MTSVHLTFGRALCKHFGLENASVLGNIQVNTKQDEIFSVTLTIALTADDLAGIAEQMKIADSKA